MNTCLNVAVDYFRNLFNDIDMSAEEIAFTNGAMEEVCFNYKSDLPVEHFQNFHVIREADFPEIDDDAIESFSFQIADNRVYQEDKFVIMINTAKTDCFFYPELNCFNPWIDYYVNLPMKSRKKYAKFMDMDLIENIHIELPEGVEILKEFGAGIWSDINPNLVGVYLTSKDYHSVYEYFKAPAPLPKHFEHLLETQTRHIFGLVVDRDTLEPKKLNYYYYPKGERRDIHWK